MNSLPGPPEWATLNVIGANNLQATFAGFGKVTKENVFKVCDVPHPDLMQEVINLACAGKFQDACTRIDVVYNEGYNMVDIINTLTKVIQNTDSIPHEELRLNFLKEASVVKMRTLEGTVSRLQLHGFLATMCQLSALPPRFSK